ncbi:MAG: hypothetical protein QOE92_1650 [Chloroflexota bacterium]|jgi:signal transduction histidine kinase|nr:hypothetical protein [Chloroflexota bacterium]
MAELLLGLQYAVAAGFVVVGVVSIVDWWRHRDPSRAYLALAVGLLAFVSVASPFSALLPVEARTAVGLVLGPAFMVAGYALLLFRNSIMPLRPWIRRALGGATAIATLAIVALVLFPGSPPPVQFGAIILVFGVWVLCVGEPSVRLWLVSRGRPAVQRARLRAFSAGYLLIVLILVLSIAAAPVATNDWVRLGLQLLSVLSVPLLYVSFAPPGFLRRLWRSREEEAFSAALKELLLFTPDRVALGQRGVEWATRLLGADGGVVEDAGVTLASTGLEPAVEADLLRRILEREDGIAALGSGRSAIVASWDLEAGPGGLAVTSGPFTPLFGTDEAARLAQYAVAITAALDRVRLVEDLRRSEADVRELNVGLERRVAQRTAQLEASNKELEAFSYTVSHDLRAPLRAIDGFSRILQDEHREGLSDGARRYLDLVSGNAQDMGRLIDGLLTFSRLSRAPIQKQSINPSEVAAGVAATLRAGLNGRRVDIDIQPMEPCRSDPILLQQVFANLLGNAVKFTRDREVAHVEVGSQPAESAADGPYVYFVKDNGVGFDMKYSDKLFGVFQRLHGTTEYEGTGAGLAIVQRIVHRHGGRVWAESEPGKGASFYFTLGEDAA